ncbi:MAG: hypothetical protein ACJ735_05155 [Actinomycetes bacterium]
MAEPLRSLAWVESLDAVTLALVTGVDVNSQLRALFGEPAEERLEMYCDALERSRQWDGGPSRIVVQFASTPGGDVLIEPNGCLMGTYADAMTRDGGAVVAVSWQDAIGADRVTFARGGRIVRTFKTRHRDAGGEGQQQPEEANLPWAYSPRTAMAALFERVATRPLTEEWLLRTPRRTWLITDPQAEQGDDEADAARFRSASSRAGARAPDPLDARPSPAYGWRKRPSRAVRGR